MKRYIRSNSQPNWPTEEEWWDGFYNEDPDFFLDNIWFEYLQEPENAVNNKLQVFPEPSTQGGVGSVFVFDESGQDRFSSEDTEYDFQDWTENEVEMAASSASAEEFAAKYEDFIRKLCNI